MRPADLQELLPTLEDLATHGGARPRTEHAPWLRSVGAAVSSSPKVFADVVYIGSTNNVLYALKATNGSFIWSYATGGQIVSSPTVIDGMVYAGSNDGNVYALWFNDATLLWSYSTSRAVESSPAVVLGSY